MIRTKQPKKKPGRPKKKATDKLTPKEQEFTDLWLSNKGNPTPLHNYQCYMKVYPRTKTKEVARYQSSELLARPHVKHYIDEIEKKIKQKVIDKISIKEYEVIRGLKRIALFDERKLYDDNYKLKHIKDLDDDTALALNTIKYGNYKIKKTVRKGKGSKAVTIKKEIIKQYVSELKGEARKPAWELLGKHLNMFEEKEVQGSPEEFVTGVRTFAEDIEEAVPGGEL